MSLDITGTIVPYGDMTRDDLITRLEQHAATRGISPATITSRAVGNSRLYQRLTDGGDCTLEVAQRLIAFMDGEAAATGG